MFYYDHSKRKGSRPAQLQPSALVSVNAQIRKYFERSEAARLQMDVPTVWKVTLSAEVVDALRKLSHDKCPFCERQGVPLQPYRFRPPAYADPPNAPADRSCYLWLSFHWENLFPICADCLPSKKSLFPVSGPRAAYPIDRSMAAIENGPGIDLGEAAELIYPGELENPAEVFDVTMDGVLIGNDERARATIQNYSLNRPQLVQARRTAFLDFIDDLLRARPFSSRAKDPFVNLPFGGALALLLRKILGEFDQSESARGRLAVEPVQDLARDWSRRADFATGIESAVTTLRAGEEVAPLPQPDEASPPAAPRKVLNRLEEISIRSFRSLDNLTLVVPPLTTADVTPPPSITGARWRPSTPCLLILGENAAGKSSVLEAVALASLSQKEVDKLSLDKTTIPLKPSFMGSPEMEQPAEATVSLKYSGGSRRFARVPRSQGKIAVTSTGAAKAPVVFAYGARRLYGAEVRTETIRHVDTLFHPQRHVSNPEPWLISLFDGQRDALGEVVSALRYVIEIDGEFEDLFVDIDDNERHCFLNIQRAVPGKEKVTVRHRLDVVSSGYRAVLAVLCDIFQGLVELADVPTTDRKGFAEVMKSARHAHAVVLIDEIEAHMHPRWKLGIVAGLRQAFPNITFILTSHDPLCVRGMLDHEVVMLNRYFNDGEGLKERVECVSGFGDLSRMTVEQLLTSNLFQLFSTDDSEVDTRYSEIVQLLGKPRASLSDVEAAVVSDFEKAIEEALPFGRNEVSLFVQRTIAKYVASRRDKPEEKVSEFREDAEKAVVEFLSGLLK